MNVNCNQYRKSMELLALKMKLESDKAPSREQEDILKRIRALEKELDLD